MLRDNRAGRRLVMVALLFALLLATSVYGATGCGEAGGVIDTTPDSGDSIEHPSGAKDLVLQVFAHDGFVPVSYHLTQLPRFSLYGDGTVIVTGPEIMMYPRAALPSLQVTTISEEAVQAILAAAREAGLFANDVDYGRPGITDMPMTTITVNADGTTYTSNIYALGMEKGAGGLNMEQQQARAAINELAGKLTELSAFETGEIMWAPYECSALAVFSTPLDSGNMPGADGVEPNRLEWPLGGPDSLGEPIEPQGYRKTVVSGQDLVELRNLLDNATEITIWTIGDREYNLYFRPLLPGETE